MDQEDTRKKIREARIEMGWSQQKLASETNMSNKTISAYELGTLGANLKALRSIAKAVGKPITFFTDEASPNYQIETRLKKIERELEIVKDLLEKQETNE